MKLNELLNAWKSGYLFESPQLTAPTDFDLTNEAKNKAQAAKLLKKKKEVFEETDDILLFLTGDGINGYIALYNKHKKELDYEIKYQAQNRKAIGGSVTQVKLWRRKGNPFVQGLTRKVFFEILLKRWTTIMSDKTQTEHGMSFWDDRMAESTTKGFSVGILDERTQKVNWFNGKPAEYEKWIRSHEGWGEHFSFRNKRYVISLNRNI